MSLQEIEKALKHLRREYTIREGERAKVIILDEDIGEIFSTKMIMTFQDDILENFIFEENKYFLEYVQKFIIKHVLSTTGYNFEIASENSFTTPKGSTISPSERGTKKIAASLADVYHRFQEFIGEIKTKNDQYKSSPATWISKNLPEKINSIKACLNISPLNSFVDIDVVYYEKIVNRKPSSDFRPYRLIIVSKDINFVEVLAITPIIPTSPEEPPRTVCETISKGDNFNETIERIAGKLYPKEQYASRNQITGHRKEKFQKKNIEDEENKEERKEVNLSRRDHYGEAANVSEFDRFT